jgi:hypothetical protein
MQEMGRVTKIRVALIGVQALFVVALALVCARPIPFEFSRPMAAALLIWLFGLTFMGFRLCWSLARAGAPLSQIGGAVKQEWPTISRAFWWAVVLGLAMALHGWAKSMIPHVSGYWADPYLADLDHLLFGQDPWRLVRHDHLTPIYAKAYVSWFPITFGTMGVLAFSRGNQQRLLTLYLAVLIAGGTIGQYVLPSAGPIFYERMGFGARFHELVATNDPTYARFADYLWTNLTAASANLGTGISAMPSMHVSMAIWTIFAAHAIWKPLAIPAAGYALTVWLASVASGWHYATDGVVGGLVVLVCYRLIVRPREAEAAPELAATPA